MTRNPSSGLGTTLNMPSESSLPDAAYPPTASQFPFTSNLARINGALKDGASNANSVAHVNISARRGRLVGALPPWCVLLSDSPSTSNSHIQQRTRASSDSSPETDTLPIARCFNLVHCVTTGPRVHWVKLPPTFYHRPTSSLIVPLQVRSTNISTPVRLPQVH